MQAYSSWERQANKDEPEEPDGWQQIAGMAEAVLGLSEGEPAQAAPSRPAPPAQGEGAPEEAAPSRPAVPAEGEGPSGPAPPAAKAAPREPVRGRIKTVQEETIQVWSYGELRYNSNTNTIRAFCTCLAHSQPCSKQRSLVAGKRKGQGRPIGYLVAWLRDQDSHASKEEHVWMSGVHKNFDLRLKAREDFSALPGARAWLDKERARTAEEPHEEPLVVAD